MNRKAIFDAVRRMLGRGFTSAEVTALDSAIESAALPDAPTAPETPVAPMRISAAGVQLIKRFEGCARLRPDGRYEAYPDPGSGGDPWTIGWGATGPDIGPGTVWTKAQCDDWFEEHIQRYESDVRRALGAALTGTSQAQFDALVSFHYNTGAIFSATLTRKHAAGDFSGAADQFARWVFASGRKLPGLVRRRVAEADMYRKGSR